MKLFVIPTSSSFCPYLRSYPLEDTESVSLVWDRLHNEESGPSKVIYRDSKVGYKRGFLDYLRFSLFVTFWIIGNAGLGVKVVVFSPQMLFFLWPVLFYIRASYVVDYRDYHRLTKYTPGFAYKKASLIVVSSPLYNEVLPRSARLTLSHNFKTGVAFSDALVEYDESKPIVVSCIGAIRDFKANSELIEALSNDFRFSIRFDGEGVCSGELEEFSRENGYDNVFFTGRYERDAEACLYAKASIVNLLRYSVSYNDRVALPNRLYNAALYRKPVICYGGTLLSRYVIEYGLGVCVDGKDDIKKALLEYCSNFNYSLFLSNVNRFLDVVESENEVFNNELEKFYDGS